MASVAQVSALSTDLGVPLGYSGALCWNGASTEPPRKGRGMRKERALGPVWFYVLV